MRTMQARLMSTGLILGPLCLSATADITYSYAMDQSIYNVAPGASQTVKIYLQETLDNGSTSLIQSDGGLGGAGFKVQAPSGSAATITGVGFNPAFNYDAGSINGSPAGQINQALLTATSAKLLESTASGGVPLGSGADAGRVYLGTITIQAPLTPGASTDFMLGRYGSGYDVITAGTNGYILDVDSAAPAYKGATDLTTFTVSAVPEPTALGLTLTGSMLLLRRRAVQGSKRTMGNRRGTQLVVFVA